MKNEVRPFLKWAGNKLPLSKQIGSLLPTGGTLIEPFVGAGSVFLNTNYRKFILNDSNSDLINLYKLIQEEGEKFIEYVKRYFVPKNNDEKRYYELREKFNQEEDVWERSALFIYFNRHGYNGLCRYNASGKFNVPFGRYAKPLFPEEALYTFYGKSKKAVFTCDDFRVTMKQAKKGNILYCDPPYVPLSLSASFAQYHQREFSEEDQYDLALLAQELAEKKTPVLISNHDTPFTRKIYNNAEILSFPVRRSISCKIDQRKPVMELLALFNQ